MRLFQLRQLIFVFLICSNLYSQSDSAKKIIRIYTSPFQAIDFSSRPMITIGSELIALNRIGLSAEFGYKYKDVDNFDTIFIKSKGYSYRFEIKIYYLKIINIKRFQDYLSLEYRNIKDDFNSMFYYSADSLRENRLTEDYAVQKDIYIGNIKYGMIFGFGKIMYVDIYCGIGIRYRDIININRTFDENLGHEHWWPEYFWTIGDFEEYSGLKFNFSFGLKFGIEF